MGKLRSTQRTSCSGRSAWPFSGTSRAHPIAVRVARRTRWTWTTGSTWRPTSRWPRSPSAPVRLGIPRAPHGAVDLDPGHSAMVELQRRSDPFRSGAGVACAAPWASICRPVHNPGCIPDGTSPWSLHSLSQRSTVAITWTPSSLLRVAKDRSCLRQSRACA